MLNLFPNGLSGADSRVQSLKSTALVIGVLSGTPTYGWRIRIPMSLRNEFNVQKGHGSNGVVENSTCVKKRVAGIENSGKENSC